VNKTLYLPDNEAETWEKARRLANDHLSPVILKALKDFVAAKNAEPTGFERIEVTFDDRDSNGLPRRKAFHGKWIFGPEKPLQLFNEDYTKGNFYCIAVTAKNNVVVYMWDEERENGEHYVSHRRFVVYPSWEKAAEDPTINYAAREAIRKQGVPLEELDI
jgi:hypothetical protein